jgi:hypothetical protein
MLRLDGFLEFLWVGSDYSVWKMLIVLIAAVAMIALVIYLAAT